MPISRRILLLLALGAGSPGLWAQDSLPLPEPLEPRRCGPMEIGAGAGGGDELELEAGRMEREGGKVNLGSDVRARRGALRAGAETMQVDEERERASLGGGVRISGPGMALEAEQAELEYGTGRMTVVDARYRLGGGATGRARRLTRSPEGVLQADEASYSTCALEDPAWRLEAEAVRIDPGEGRGEARNAVLRLGSAPVMVLPWVGFPVGDARKSGWLMPELGTSDDLGYSLELPYYFNLAAHYDLVLAGRYMGRRGLQVKPGARYRTRHGAGAVDLEYLSDNEYDDDRYLTHWRYSGARPNGWDYRVNYTNVSDGDYLGDFQSGIDGSSKTRLRQEAHAAYRSADWTFSAGLEGGDPLKGRREQWDRVPKIRTKGRFRVPAAGLVLTPVLSADAFRGDLQRLHVQGERYDASLVATRKFAGAGWQVTPRLQWRHTHYELEFSDAAKEAAALSDERLDRSPSRTMPIFSVDARARLERRLEDGALQTLEPRLFYFNRQRRDHSDIPNFDSRRMDPDFDTMFRIARATGPDRVGPADLLATGITTRVVDPVSGYLRLRARLGRVWYFRAPGAFIQGNEGDHAKSAWAAEFEWRPSPRLQLRSAVRHDPGGKGGDTTWASHRVGWDGADGERLQARYVRRAGEMEQADAQALLPLGENWRWVARYRYDMREGRDLELLAALEYRGCCMTVGVGAWKVRRDDGPPGEEYEKRVMVQMRLHGLAGFGEDVVGRMRRELDGRPAWSY